MAKELGSKLFLRCNNLETVYAPNLLYIAGDQCIEDTSVKELLFPKFNRYVYSNSMRSNKLLERVDLGFAPKFGHSVFVGCNALSCIILRKEDTVSILENVSAFSETHFAIGGTGGNVYVPSALIEQYQQATNWSTLYAAGTCIFKPLEDYTIDGTTTGEMDWAKIEAEVSA